VSGYDRDQSRPWLLIVFIAMIGTLWAFRTNPELIGRRMNP
jgi:hypothetical protein